MPEWLNWTEKYNFFLFLYNLKYILFEQPFFLMSKNVISMPSKFNQISNFPIHLTPLFLAEMTCMQVGLSHILSLWDYIKRTTRILVQGPRVSTLTSTDMHFIFILLCVLGSVSTCICGEGTFPSDKQALVHTLYPLECDQNQSSRGNFCILLRTRETFWLSPNHQTLRREGTPAPLSCVYFSSVNHFVCEDHKKVSCLPRLTQRLST